VVFAAVSGLDGYDQRPQLDSLGWLTMFRNLDRLAAAAAARGLTAGLHPHVGTLVERPEDVDRVLNGADIGLCLDTGHLMVGGGDPLALAQRAAGRIVHVHLKDVDASMAARVRAGVIGYTEAVAAGMYRPLGRGDAGIAGVVSALEAAGYHGWYVMEQDRVLAPDRAGSATALAAVREDVAASLAHLAAAIQARAGAA
jgi:inosose dehydratase